MRPPAPVRFIDRCMKHTRSRQAECGCPLADAATAAAQPLVSRNPGRIRREAFVTIREMKSRAESRSERERLVRGETLDDWSNAIADLKLAITLWDLVAVRHDS